MCLDFRRQLGSSMNFLGRDKSNFWKLSEIFAWAPNILIWFLLAQGIYRMFFDFFSLEDIFIV